jgi:hypothetical protein
MNKNITIYVIAIMIIQSIIILDLLNKRNESLIRVVDKPELTNIDTIYMQIDSLQKQSDTIKLYYEKKTSNYHILPRSERIKLFADRINRQ